MIPPIKLCVFDMAGTCVNEDNIVYKTLEQALKEEGISLDLAICLRYGAGQEKFQAIKDILEVCQQQQRLTENQQKNLPNIADQAFKRFNRLLENAYNHQSIQEFKGMKDFFHELRSKKIKLVLNTGYQRATAEKIIDIMGWKIGIDIDALICASDVKNPRPQPDMIYRAMEQFSISDSRHVLKAGDSIIDIEEGKNANCGYLVGVLSGAQTQEQLQSAQPDMIVPYLTDIRPLLLDASSC